MISSVVADTNVLSFIFKKDSRAELYRPHIDHKIVVVSFMTIAELDRWALHHAWGRTRRQSMEAFLQGFLFHFCDRSLCLKWAEATDSARRNGRPIETADAWIAATAFALLLDIPLVTHNRSHYLGVDGLTLLSETT